MKLSEELVELAAKHGPLSPKGVENLTEGRITRQNAWNALKRGVRDDAFIECPGAPGTYLLARPPRPSN